MHYFSITSIKRALMFFTKFETPNLLLESDAVVAMLSDVTWVLAGKDLSPHLAAANISILKGVRLG